MERDFHIGHRGVILGEAHIVQRETAVPALEACKCIIYKGAGDLPRAVRAEIEEHHAVPGGYAAAFTGHGGHDEFVRHAVRIAFFHHFFRCAVHAFAVYHGGVGLFHTVPAVVAVHGVIAARDGGDLAHADLGHFGFQLFAVRFHLLQSAQHFGTE